MTQLARFVLGGSWIYHGLFPKLLTVAPLEREMTGSIGLSDENTLLLTQAAGVCEILFGAALILYYRNSALLLLNLFAFIALLAFVTAMTPHLLVEAFNPVTTNIPLIALSFYLLSQANQGSET